MKRTDAALLALALVLLLAGLAWGGTWALRRRSAWQTAVCRAYTLERRQTLRGVVVREEQTLSDGWQFRRVTVPSGARCGAGDVLGVGYDTGAEYFRTALLLRLRRELSAREAAAARADAGPADGAALRQEAAALSLALARQDAAAAAEAGLALRLRLPDGHDAPARIRTLKTEIASLAAAGGEAGLLTAPAAGFFSPAADGWEELSPADPAGLTAERLAAVLAEDRPAPEVWGKLVTGSGWLLAAPVSAEEAAGFRAGDTVTLELPGGGVAAEVLSPVPGTEETVVVLACRTGLEQVLELRRGEFSALLSRTEGLLLPGDALREEDGSAYVFRAAGPFARREEVAVLARLGGGVLVRAEGLRDGSRVLVGDGVLTDGALWQ